VETSFQDPWSTCEILAPIPRSTSTLWGAALSALAASQPQLLGPKTRVSLNEETFRPSRQPRVDLITNPQKSSETCCATYKSRTGGNFFIGRRCNKQCKESHGASCRDARPSIITGHLRIAFRLMRARTVAPACCPSDIRGKQFEPIRLILPHVEKPS
jgi:hypothetical protein